MLQISQFDIICANMRNGIGNIDLAELIIACNYCNIAACAAISIIIILELKLELNQLECI